MEPAWFFRAQWADGCLEGPSLEGSASFRLPRGEVCAVLAYPLVDGRHLRPAGIVSLPDSTVDGAESLTWRGGYEAECARALLRAGVDPGCFDIARFSSDAFSRMEDPWVTDPEGFADDFRDGFFRVSWLDMPDTYTVRADGLPGPAASESPFGGSLAPDGEGGTAVELTEGVHRWYADWGRVSVEVDGEGNATWLIVR